MGRPNDCLTGEFSHNPFYRGVAKSTALTKQDSSVGYHDDTVSVAQDDDPNRQKGKILAGRLSWDHRLNHFARLK
jgi:hypothetical protein